MCVSSGTGGSECVYLQGTGGSECVYPQGTGGSEMCVSSGMGGSEDMYFGVSQPGGVRGRGNTGI